MALEGRSAVSESAYRVDVMGSAQPPGAGPQQELWPPEEARLAVSPYFCLTTSFKLASDILTSIR
jgi:hypothetical protein